MNRSAIKRLNSLYVGHHLVGNGGLASLRQVRHIISSGIDGFEPIPFINSVPLAILLSRWPASSPYRHEWEAVFSDGLSQCHLGFYETFGTPLMHACATGNTHRVRTLVVDLKSPVFCPLHGNVPMDYAVSSSIIFMLLDAGAWWTRFALWFVINTSDDRLLRRWIGFDISRCHWVSIDKPMMDAVKSEFYKSLFKLAQTLQIESQSSTLTVLCLRLPLQLSSIVLNFMIY